MWAAWKDYGAFGIEFTASITPNEIRDQKDRPTTCFWNENIQTAWGVSI